MFQETSSPSEMATVEKILYNACKFVQAAVAEVELISSGATHLLILSRGGSSQYIMILFEGIFKRIDYSSLAVTLKL